MNVEVVGVYTRPPKAAGRRGLLTTKTAIHESADALGIAVSTPASLRNPDAVAQFAALRADVAIVAAYGLILPRAVLDCPSYGCLNLHGSVLPRWRGAAPVQRAIMAGDKTTGVCLMRMEEGLDTGPVADVVETRISPDETSGELTDRLSLLAAELLERCWETIERRDLSFQSQPENGALYAKKIDKSECAIDWSKSADQVRDQIHGLSPFPGAYSQSAASGAERVKFLRAEATVGSGKPGAVVGPGLVIACGSGAIRALSVQFAGKTVIAGDEVVRGGRLKIGDGFDSRYSDSGVTV